MAPDLSPRARLASLQDLSRTRFDLLVVGGGISGAGIAHDAALRGLRVCLVERGDFASGTSSKSSKLLHGGLRYLEQFRFGLVTEALRERNALFDQAPHLAREIPFIYPVPPGGRLALWQAQVGLSVYDALGVLSGLEFHRWHRSLDPEGLRSAEPSLAGAHVIGALRYIDGLTDDARLVVEVIKAAVAAGARALNYCPVERFLRDGAGRAVGARVRDGFLGRAHEVHAAVVVNAAGPWIDAVNRLDAPDIPRRLLPTKGVHVVVPNFTQGQALAIKSLPHADGRRRWMFVIPWGERSIIGTTDTANPGQDGGDGYLDADAIATPGEVAYLLGSVNAACPGLELRPHDVISAYAGWRPLVAPETAAFESDISREHEVFETPSGILCLAGGKLTTYRVMARQMVERVVGRLQAIGRPFGPLRRPRPAIPYGGYAGGRDLEELAEAERRKARSAAEARLVSHLARIYGGGAMAVLEIARSHPRMAAEIGGLSAETPHWRAQVAHAVRHEGALSVADVLARRTRIQIVDAFGGLGCLQEVTELVARELGEALGWQNGQRQAWAEREAAAYEREIRRMRSFRDRAPES